MEKISTIRELYWEFREGDRIELNDRNEKVRLLKYINSELKRLSELHINIISHNPQMKNFRIEQITEHNHLIRVKKMIEGNLGRKKTDIKLDLNLSDILIEGLTAEQIKKYYKNPDENVRYLGMFLRVLRQKGYFNSKVTDKQIEVIGRNEFIPTYIDSRNYKPPENLNIGEFKHIPDMK